MFDFFKKKCPVCGMMLGDKTIEGWGRHFCSESCKKEFGDKLVEASRNKPSCCH